MAEATRLAKTIDRWRVELLAYSRTNRASSGPVEAVNGEIEQVRPHRPRLPELRLAPGCCSRPPSNGGLPSPKDSRDARLNQIPPPPRQRIGPIAALLGHRPMRMAMVCPRIASRTVADE